MLQEGEFKVMALTDCRRKIKSINITDAYICTKQTDRAHCDVKLNFFLIKNFLLPFDTKS